MSIAQAANGGRKFLKYEPVSWLLELIFRMPLDSNQESSARNLDALDDSVRRCGGHDQT